MLKSIFRPVGLWLLVLAAGCSQDSSTQPSGTTPSVPSMEGSRFLLGEEPSGAKDVIAVRDEAESDDSVVVVGRIGGSKDPWVEGRAAFSIVDTSLLPCSEREGDECPIPWDYCCETDKLPISKALVKFVDESGQLLAVGARELFDIKELQTVVVRGTAKRDDAGNLTIFANGLFIRN